MKLLTLNLNFDEAKHGPWKVRRDLIAQAVRAWRPDVVALQAVRRLPDAAGGTDQAQELAADLPEFRHVRFEPALTAPDGVQRGSAILSTVPLRDYRAMRLTPPPSASQDSMPRLVLIATVGAVTILNAHYSWIAKQTAGNVTETAALGRTLAGGGLLVGDFNATPDAPALGPLRADGWIDVWDRLRPDDAGWTYESHAPDKRIDYVWATRDLAPRLRTIEVVQAPPNAHGARLSDHLGLCVEWDEGNRES